MKTEVIMKRELFGNQISQKSKSEFFSVTELVKAGNTWRKTYNKPPFNLSLFLQSKSTIEFMEELENKYGVILIKGRGRNAQTWAHPLLFIEIALAINPRLKIEVYEWIVDNLIKFRNDSGDSYKAMSGALYMRYKNHTTFPKFMKWAAKKIKDACEVHDWQEATEEQLKLRDKIHFSIKLLSNVLTSPRQAVRVGVNENIK